MGRPAAGMDAGLQRDFFHSLPGSRERRLRNGMATGITTGKPDESGGIMKILIVSGMEGVENCTAALGRLLGMECDAAQGRKTALAALKRSEYAALVVD